jgi:hypothetical protein
LTGAGSVGAEGLIRRRKGADTIVNPGAVPSDFVRTVQS